MRSMGDVAANIRKDEYVVLCRTEDYHSGYTPLVVARGDYTVAGVFTERQEAADYAVTISSTHNPVITQVLVAEDGYTGWSPK